MKSPIVMNHKRNRKNAELERLGLLKVRKGRCCICRKASHNSSTCPDRKLPPMKVAYSFDLTED
jgi:hypothetical protein